MDILSIANTIDARRNKKDITNIAKKISKTLLEKKWSVGPTITFSVKI